MSITRLGGGGGQDSTKVHIASSKDHIVIRNRNTKSIEQVITHVPLTAISTMIDLI